MVGDGVVVLPTTVSVAVAAAPIGTGNKLFTTPLLFPLLLHSVTIAVDFSSLPTAETLLLKSPSDCCCCR